MAAVLSLAVFLSGAAALMFEALWLRRAGLMLGNSVWASSIVLAAFMAGLAIGNALAVRRASRVARPLRLYAWLEITAGAAGAAIILAVPVLTPVLAPLFRRLGDAPGATNVLRLAIAFGLALLPTTAMGMTLPVLTRALSRGSHDFGRVLGRLYGWNTLGGVVGVIASELWLVGLLGLRGTAFFAAGLNLAAAALAWWYPRQVIDATAVPAEAVARARLGPRSVRLLAAAFVAGASLLALEVIWFRFLQLFMFGTTLVFAIMLAVVLLGIGAGGFVASLWSRWDANAHRWLSAVAGAAALAATVSYAAFSPWYRGAAFFISQPDATLVLSLRLMLATSLVSGVLFTFVGATLRHEVASAAETTGLLTLANTFGSMAGALGAGFLFLPLLGIERSIVVLVALYGVVAALCGAPSSQQSLASGRGILAGSLAAVGLCLALFPRGAMQIRHLQTSRARFLDEATHVAAIREGVDHTTTLLRTEWNGHPISHRLVTNGYSMSGTDLADRRYMKLFVNWAVAVNPRIQRALLISYGLGSTAEALTHTRALTAIHVVDTSREILDLAPAVFAPAASPLADPRVRLHVEDGRFFLQNSTESFDLITGEPPPPKAAGIVNLYSREYFRLLHDRLNEGGVATYWLPAEELDEDDARAVVGAFCAAFADCSLWTGAGAHWMLAGTRGLRERATEEAFVAQWRNITLVELYSIGLEKPEQLGATFLADAEQLAPWLAGVPPLDDDHPQRLSPRRPDPARQDYIERWMDVEQAAERFQRSKLVDALWPPDLRARTGDFFALQRHVNAVTAWPARWPGLEALREVLEDARLHTLPLLMAGSSPLLQEIAWSARRDGARSQEVEMQVAIGVLVRRDYASAARRFAAAAAAGGPETTRARMYQAFALLTMGGNDRTGIDAGRISRY